MTTTTITRFTMDAGLAVGAAFGAALSAAARLASFALPTGLALIILGAAFPGRPAALQPWCRRGTPVRGEVKMAPPVPQLSGASGFLPKQNLPDAPLHRLLARRQ